MISRILRCAGFAAMFVAGHVQAGALDLNLNDESVRVNYTSSSLGVSTVGVDAPQGTELELGLLYVEGDDDISNVYLVNAGIHTKGSPLANGDNTLIVALGARAYAIDFGKIGGGAIGLGGNVEVRFKSFDRIGFYGHGYYAPDIIAFGDLDASYEYGIRIGYEILRTSEVYIGYRELGLDLVDNPKIEADSNLVLGFRYEL